MSFLAIWGYVALGTTYASPGENASLQTSNTASVERPCVQLAIFPRKLRMRMVLRLVYSFSS